MHLDGYKYWLAYKKGSKSYYRCSRSKSQKCPGKLIMENSKVITSIPHDHDKEARNNAVEKFRKVLTKKAIEKPNKALVDIYLEETLNHSEASILYPFAQAESTMRKARGKVLEEKKKIQQKSETEKIYEQSIEEVGRKNEENIQNTLTKIDENFTKMDKLETKMESSEQKYRKFEHQSKTFEGSMQNFDEKLQNIEKKLDNIQKKRRKIEEGTRRVEKNASEVKNNPKTYHHQKYFYIESISENTKLILMNQGTLSTLGKIEEVHIDCGMKVDVRDVIRDVDGRYYEDLRQKCDKKDQNTDQKCSNLVQEAAVVNQTPHQINQDQNLLDAAPVLSDLPQISFLDQNFTYTNQHPLESYENISVVYQNFNQTEHSQIIQTIEFSACSSSFGDANIANEPFYSQNSNEQQEIDMDFAVEKEQVVTYNVNYNSERSTGFVFEDSVAKEPEVTAVESNQELIGPSHYYQDFFVSCSDNSNNSSHIQFHLHQNSAAAAENSAVSAQNSAAQIFGTAAQNSAALAQNSAASAQNSAASTQNSAAAAQNFAALAQNSAASSQNSAAQNFGAAAQNSAVLAQNSAASAQHSAASSQNSAAQNFGAAAQNSAALAQNSAAHNFGASAQNSAASAQNSADVGTKEQNLSKLSKNLQKSRKNTENSNHNLKYQTSSYQILTVVALIKGRDCPIAIGFTKSPTPETIQQLLNFIKLKISLNPTTILTNQDQTLQQSIHISWPESTVKIMYFYYAQSVLKNLNKSFTEISKNIFEISSLKMILSMPLIPTNYIIPGWEALRKWMNEKNVDLNSLCDDVYAKWFAENAEKISIFNGLTHSINNHTQVFQSELINSFEAVPVDFESLLDKISRQATKNYIKFTKTSETSANKIQKLQKTVKIATKSWISSPFHLRRPIQFLQQVSHCIDDGMINFVINFDGNFCEVKKLEPPPLVFFESKEVSAGVKGSESGTKQTAKLPSEPPPLVPIRR